MGHVDHGKTTLLDAIRQTSVVETEAGGITQHIGAYQAEHAARKITFLDTPGHEAFTAMRARGAKVTDIAVLVVAADDGVMPQTKESISHARAAEVPIVVAVNKIDLPGPIGPREERARRRGASASGAGRREFSEVSAKQGENLDDLLERILLVADAELEAQGQPERRSLRPDHRVAPRRRSRPGRNDARPPWHAHGRRRRHRGRRRVGEGAGAYNYRGEKIREARPGEPVEILGFDKPPAAGEHARVVENERAARHSAQTRGERLRREQLAQQTRRRMRLEDVFNRLQEGEAQDLNLVLKGDVVGSVEAAVGELEKIQHPEVRVNVIHKGAGGITEGDVMLASASSAMIVGFNVRPNAEARSLADREGVEIRTYRVIYQLTEDIEQALVGMLKPTQVEETIGEAEVRALFRVSRLGTIAGCYVTNGVVRRNAVRVVRDGTVVQESTIADLKRFKDDVREVQEGFECGIRLDEFNDVKEGDVLEVYETRQVERTDLSTPAPATPATTT